MKRKQILAVSLLCISLVSCILIGQWALTRVSALSAYASAKIIQSETSLNLTIYGDPEMSRQTFDLFEYFTTQNLQWRGTTKDPQGNTINVGLNLTSVEFQKLDADNYALAAEDVAFQLRIADLVNADLVNALVRANEVNIDVTFWTCMDLPALNITAVLVGDVEVSLFFAVLPLPGLQQAAYSYTGDRYVISVCILKPIEVDIVNLWDGDRVNGDVEIQAEVKTAPGISAENVRWWTEGEGGHFEGDMSFNDLSGYWEGVWPSYYCGNGWYELAVRAEGVDRKPGVQEFRYPDEDRIKVEVENPPFWVRAYLETSPDYFEEIPVEMDWWYHEQGGRQTTPFEAPRLRDYGLMAPGEWDGMHFERWVIRDEAGNPIFKHWDPKIEVNEEILKTLGMERQLECIYKPA